MAGYVVTFLPSSSSVEVPPGTSLREAARVAGLALQSPCGGQGRCGKCLVRATGEVSAPTVAETGILSPDDLAGGWRLACQAKALGAVTVTAPSSSLVAEHRIVLEGIERAVVVQPNVRKVALHLPAPSVDDQRADLSRLLDALGGTVRPPSRVQALRSLPGALRRGGFHVTAVTFGDELGAVEAGDTTDDGYGLAVDVGTTTVVAYLCHLPTGECVAVASDLNAQAQWGYDVISRIQAANSDESALRDLSRAAREVVNDLVARATHQAGVSAGSIYELVAVGNTCMTHLLLGVAPAGLGTVPFAQTFRSPQTALAADLGIAVHPQAQVYVVPNIGGFVGADTVGVILASELDRSDGLRVAVDIGTNGEIVVARGGEVWASSTAAGPAFEGARIRQGMRAADGAIEQVTIGDDVSLRVIGEVRPRGICGSGLVDAVAELVRVGVVTENGRMLGPGEVPALPEKVARRVVENGAGVAFVLAWPEEAYGDEAIALTAQDVRQTQLAKAAIIGGMELMLDGLGAGAGEVEELLLAGAFGNYIRRESALAIGLIPNLPPERIRSIGNAAGAGARLALCSVEERRRAERLAGRVHHVELSANEGFYDRFARAMMLRPLAS